CLALRVTWGQDVAYVNWLTMVVKGVEGMQTYNPHTKSWLQAHSRARFVIMRVLLEAGDLVEIRETTGEDGKPDLLITCGPDENPLFWPTLHRAVPPQATAIQVNGRSSCSHGDVRSVLRS
ncbi:hypothetical protein MTO96_035135, partial [Rhipicephalus appendiculatus]